MKYQILSAATLGATASLRTAPARARTPSVLRPLGLEDPTPTERLRPSLRFAARPSSGDLTQWLQSWDYRTNLEKKSTDPLCADLGSPCGPKEPIGVLVGQLGCF